MSRSVLVVEDEDDIRALVEMSLIRVGGLTVRAVGSGAAALAVLDEWVPDAVLLDVQMPAMSGPEVLTELRARHPDLPVVFLTASVRQDEVALMRSMSAQGVLGKPFDPLTLPAELGAVLGW